MLVNMYQSALTADWQLRYGKAQSLANHTKNEITGSSKSITGAEDVFMMDTRPAVIYMIMSI